MEGTITYKDIITFEPNTLSSTNVETYSVTSSTVVYDDIITFELMILSSIDVEAYSVTSSTSIDNAGLAEMKQDLLAEDSNKIDVTEGVGEMYSLLDVVVGNTVGQVISTTSNKNII